jgi:thiosulfate/3-mercaptopyruvate sulfurtransferase
MRACGPSAYRGDVEPIDPIGGHIPGARNRPYTENLAPQGTFQAGGRLRRNSRRRSAAGHSAVVHQCGSGVTACHNAPADGRRWIAGIAALSALVGEWIADPARPVATGADREKG